MYSLVLYFVGFSVASEYFKFIMKMCQIIQIRPIYMKIKLNVKKGDKQFLDYCKQ